MDVALYLTLISGLLKMAFNLWASVRKILGKEKIPSWDELVAANTDLQVKIDAEKA